MGLITPKTPAADSTMDPSLAQSITISPGECARAGGPDAYQLNAADFPGRKLPLVSGSRDATYQVVFRQSVLERDSCPWQDFNGSRSLRDAGGRRLLRRSLARGRMSNIAFAATAAVAKQTQVTITSETWTRMHETA